MTRLLAFIGLLAMILVRLGSSSVGAASDLPGIDPRLTEYPEVRFIVHDSRIEAPVTVTAGRSLVVHENRSAAPEPSHIFLMRVPDDVSDAQLATDRLADVTALPEWFYRGTVVGNPDLTGHNGGLTYGVVDFVVGRYIVMSPSVEPVLVSRFDVVTNDGATGSGVDLAIPPVADVTATTFEMDFKINGPVPAGRQIWEIANTGSLLHEMAIVPVPAGATDADVITAFSALIQGNPIWAAELGPDWAEWSGQEINGGGAMSGGRTIWVQFDLPPGTYAAVCFVPGAGFMPHLMEGMVNVFTVTA